MKIREQDRNKIKSTHKKRVGKNAWEDFGIEKDVDFILDEIEKLD